MTEMKNCYVAHYLSPLGEMTMASDGTVLTGLWFNGQKYFAAGLEEDPQEADLPVFRETACWLDSYFAGRNPSSSIALHADGSPFREKVWQILLTIPYGQVMTYGQIAECLACKEGRPVSARAVGGAVGHNPISILIPCHRVIGTGNRITGYAGGLDRKKALLLLEGYAGDALK